GLARGGGLRRRPPAGRRPLHPDLAHEGARRAQGKLRANQGTQQNVRGVPGVASPTGCPPVAAQLPPCGPVTVALRDPTLGLRVRLAQLPAWNVTADPVQLFSVEVR